MNRQVLVALLRTLYFVEESDESTVDPDAAVALLEAVAVDLQQLDPDSTAEFLRELMVAAHSEGEELRSFAAQLGESLGLRDSN